MTRIDTTTLASAELTRMLRAWAKGILASEAAVELLVQHDVWAHRPDFRATLVDAVDDGWGPDGEVMPLAAIAWDQVEDLLDVAACSSSEAAILRLAASLAGSRTTASLMEATSGLDDTNSALVLDAFAHRFGWHERGRVRLVTGTFDDAAAPESAPPAQRGRRG